MKSWSLNAKFSGVLSIFVLAAIVISTVAILRLQFVKENMNELIGVVAQRVVLSQKMLERTSAIRNFEKVVVIEESKEGMEKVGLTLDAVEGELKKMMDDYSNLATDAGKKNLAEMRGVLDNEWKPVSLRLRELAMQGKNVEAAALARGKSREALEKFGSELEAIEKRNTEVLQQETAHTNDVVEAAGKTIMISSIVALAMGIFLAFIVLRALNRAIDQVISNLDDNSAQVTSAAQQIASSSNELSQAATEQASALEQTASSIQELSSMVQKNTDNAKQASDVSDSSHKSAERGKKVVNDMIDAIRAINESNDTIMKRIERSNQEISEIVTVINEIGSKTKVINDIVFQTKLLSFNASVEAARAGEHGKGFAVVAEEVGTLAQMSGNASKEISSLLEGSILKVEQIVNETKEGVGKLIEVGRQRVEEGRSIAQQCGEVLEDIVGSVGNLNHMSNEIAQASREQSQGVQEITKAMHQLDQVTQINASTSEEAASASEELSAQANSLRGVVQVLISTIKGSNGKEDSHQASYNPPAKFKANAPRLNSHKSNVVSIHQESAPLKKAVGADEMGAIPSGNDSRFRDV